MATIDKVSVTTATAVRNPVIEFTLKTPYGGAVTDLAPNVLSVMVAKLVPAAGNQPARWQSYVNRSQTAAAGPKPLAQAIQANTEGGSNGVLEQLSTPGTYRYTYKVDLANVTTPLAVAYEPSLTHRVGFEIRMANDEEVLAPDNPVKDFVPDGGAGSGSNLIADTANCAACHVRFEMHGGPRRTVEYCVTCHNPGTVDPDSGESLDMAYMAHSIHSGENRGTPYVIYGFGGSVNDFSEVTYPQSTLFCENCHANAAASPDGDDWKTQMAASQCGGCHDAGLGKTYDYATGRYTNTYAHSTFAFTANDGDCLGCHKAGGVAGEILASHQKPKFASGTVNVRYAAERGREFKYEILGVTNAVAGQAPTVRLRVADKGQAIDLKNLTTGSLTLGIAWSTRDIHNVACTTDVADDPATPTNETCVAGTLANTRGRSLTLNLITDRARLVEVGDGSYDYTLAAPLPAGVNGDVMATLYGHRAFADGSRANPETAVYFPGEKRQALVSQEKCENCHELLAFHGSGARAGDPMMCNACHNSSMGWGAEGFGPLAMGAFIHNTHAGKVAAIGAVTYPQSLNRCEACHLEGTYYAARADALPISTDAGPDLDPVTSGFQNQIVYDDTWDSATAGTCGTCHDSGDAKAHMTQNGGAFAVVGNKPLTPSSAQESCAVCHGQGRIADTTAAHAAD